MSLGSSPNAEHTQRLEQWITLYGTGILRTCYLYLKDTPLAQDAMQDTFIKAWKSMARFELRNNCSEKTWLTRIAINTCRDYKRSRWLRFVDMRKSIEELPLTVQEASHYSRELFDTILALPDKLREVVLLYYYQELTLEEAADILSVSKSTIHYRLEKARKALRSTLERSEVK